jgi:hypothetical protein
MAAGCARDSVGARMKSKRRTTVVWLLLANLLVVILVSGCSESAPTVGEVKDFANACDKANDGQRIAVTGYLRLPDSFSESPSVVLRLYETDDFDGQPIGVTINFGDQPNQVTEISDQYSDEDLQVHLADGEVASFGTRVRVSGKMYYPTVSQDFLCGLSNPLVEAAP